MRKVDRVRQLLDIGASPREAAREAGCALSLVYEVRRLSGMAKVTHEIGAIKEDLREIHERLRRLEGSPNDAIRRILENELNR